MPKIIDNLTIQNWRQFRNVNINFHTNLTVITGANGAGKTSILNIIGKHIGWDMLYIATSKLKKKGVYDYYNGISTEDELDTSDYKSIGQITVKDGHTSKILVPSSVGSSFNIIIENQLNLDGVFLPSHRAIYRYFNLTQIPTTLDANSQLFENYYQNIKSMYNSDHSISPSASLKGSLISLAMFGYGNDVVQKNLNAIRTFEGFQSVLKKVLPKTIGFKRIAVRMPDVVLECDSGDFSLDAASGGISAIIDISWQIYLKSLMSSEFIIVIDEPENHLHPELQRNLLPGLIKAFPQAQFIVATHNPFVVTSVRNSTIVVLDYEDKKVVSTELKDYKKYGSSDQILTDVLGVPTPIPVWVEGKIEQIIKKYSKLNINRKNLVDMKHDMQEIGLGNAFPDAVESIMKDRNDKAR